MFEQAVSDAWRGISAANSKSGAVSLALRLLEQADPDTEFAAAPETDGQSGRYAWRRRIELVDSGAPDVAKTDDVVNFLIEVDVSWRAGVAAKSEAVRYHLYKAGRRPS